MAERALDHVARGEVEVGRRHDDHRVLAARLGEERQVGAPRAEQRRGLPRAGEDHAIDVGVRHEPLPERAFVDVDEGEHVARHAGLPQRLGDDGGAAARLRGGLEHDTRSGRERGEHATGGDRDREVPRRRDHRQTRGLEDGAAHAVELASGRRVVAREVDGLAHLDIGLGEHLAGLGGGDLDELAAARLEHPGGLERARRSARPRACAPQLGSGIPHPSARSSRGRLVVDAGGRDGRVAGGRRARCDRGSRAPRPGWPAGRGRCRARCGIPGHRRACASGLARREDRRLDERLAAEELLLGRGGRSAPCRRPAAERAMPSTAWVSPSSSASGSAARCRRARARGDSFGCGGAVLRAVRAGAQLGVGRALERREEAVALALEHRRVVGEVERGREEVVARGVLFEAAHEVADRDVELVRTHDRHVQQHVPDLAGDRGDLALRHAEEHLELDSSLAPRASPASSHAYAMSKRLWPATPMRTAAVFSGCSAKSRHRR